GSPSGGRNLPEVMPCTRLLRLEMALPCGVRGPVLFSAFSRLALVCASVAMGWGPCVSLRVMAGVNLDRGFGNGAESEFQPAGIRSEAIVERARRNGLKPRRRVVAGPGRPKDVAIEPRRFYPGRVPRSSAPMPDGKTAEFQIRLSTHPR